MTHHPCDLYTELRQLYDVCNRELFGGSLPPCMIVLRPKRRAAGYYTPACWRNDAKDYAVMHDAIALNSAIFARQGEQEVLCTLVHEMCHLWQRHYGEKNPERPYHNSEWARQMMAVGLMPSTTGKPGGKTTGRQVADYLLDRGPLRDLWDTLSAEGHPLLSWYEFPKLAPARTAEKKYRYLCPGCEQKAWAILDTHLVCGGCNAEMAMAPEQLALVNGV